MKTTRKALCSIYKKDSCGEFNKQIEDILRDKFYLSDEDEFEIDNKYTSRIKECTNEQILLLNSIDLLPPKSEWSRDSEWNNSAEYFTIDRNPISGFKILQGQMDNANKNFVFETKEEAEIELKFHTLVSLMRSWVKHHNKLDNFTPDWVGNCKKYGITMVTSNPKVDWYYWDNHFLFGLVVSSEERANEMLEEFKNDIKEIYKYL